MCVRLAELEPGEQQRLVPERIDITATKARRARVEVRSERVDAHPNRAHPGTDELRPEPGDASDHFWVADLHHGHPFPGLCGPVAPRPEFPVPEGPDHKVANLATRR